MDASSINEIMKYIAKGAISELNEEQKKKVAEAKKVIIECIESYGDSARLALTEVFFEEMSKMSGGGSSDKHFIPFVDRN